ncbi:PAS domain S-box protein [Egicoccus sp. AB-alg6-2]|uniref:hybrid sensor histidine kinase/response regulator n=1 Tax=Egicoccus sp. AB-alg6-2 TaxID=3242692 RepID=UPI00359EB735
MTDQLRAIRLSEARRLEALRRLNILDTPPEQELDDVAGLAGALLGARYAAVTFVDDRRAWSKCVRGRPGQPDVAREHSPAWLAITAEEGMVHTAVEDVPAIADHPAIAELGLVTVAAAVIVAPDGQRVGAVELGWADALAYDGALQTTLQRIALHATRLVELRAEVAEYRRFIELNPDAVTVLDLEGSIELANPMLAEVLRLNAPEDVVGRNFLELVAPEDRARAANELARVLFARRPASQMDMRLLRADGSTVACSVSAGHLRASRRSLQLVVRDLDERIRGEEERARLSEQLAQAQRLDLAGKLASGLAHDLKNLITVMSSYLDLAQGSVQDLAPAVGNDPIASILDDFEQLRRSVDRAGTLTHKLMQFAGSEGSTDEVDLARAVDGVRNLIESALGPGVMLEIDLEDDLPRVRADAVGLEQALVNLVMNSNDALPHGGTIIVRARHTDHPAAGGVTSGPNHPVDDQRRYVRLSVIDDGTGMDDETLTRAFEPLFSTKGAARGTGLGLPTVLAFAQQADGIVDLHSIKGEGTSIALVLPTVASAASPDVLDRQRPVGGKRVVLVDPNDRARRVIAQMLRSAGYRILPATDGESALRILEEQGGDVLVTELALPGIPGWRVVDRARGQRPDLPVLVFASAQAPDRVTDDVRTLVKPFSSDRLLRMLAEMLPG